MDYTKTTQCQAITRAGKLCKHRKAFRAKYCPIHADRKWEEQRRAQEAMEVRQIEASLEWMAWL